MGGRFGWSPRERLVRKPSTPPNVSGPAARLVSPMRALGDAVPRGAFAVLLLGVALAASLLLAWQACSAAASQRAVSEAVLRDDAGLAAGELVRRGASEVGYQGHYVLSQALGSAGRSRSVLLRSEDGRIRRAAALVRRTFTMDSASGQVVFEGGDDPPVAAWLALHAAPPGDRGPYAVLNGVVGGQARSFVVTAKDAGRLPGYEVETRALSAFLAAADGRAGLLAARAFRPHLIVLDLMLPGLDGFRVLKALREDPGPPVLILTARGEEADKVRGLKLGADDYVTKPFGLLELLARVEALLRRTQRGPARRLEKFGVVEVDVGARAVRKDGRAVDLAPKELDLLLALLEAEGAAVSRLDLLRRVWGYPAAVVTRTVDTHVAELRRKLEDDSAQPQHVLTVRKLGYRLRR